MSKQKERADDYSQERIIDLSGLWTVTSENGKPVEMEVPGGGWLKQGMDCEAAVYSRWLNIPFSPYTRAYVLEIGAVNHTARYWIGTNEDQLILIHEETTAFTPQSVNLTDYVHPGGKYLLKIEVRAFKNGRPVAPHAANWYDANKRKRQQIGRLRPRRRKMPVGRKVLKRYRAPRP